MEPMKPMRPMEPMKPMEPLKGEAPWWPSDLGEPATRGSQGGLRYAFFPEKHRLLVEKDGAVTAYDSGDHRIGGVSQGSGSLRFTDEVGEVDLGSLKRAD